MIQQEQNYRVILNNCKGKELEVARYLHIITGMEEHEGRKIVSNLPIILFESLDGEVCSYIEEAFDFYGIKSSFTMNPEYTQISLSGHSFLILRISFTSSL